MEKETKKTAKKPTRKTAARKTSTRKTAAKTTKNAAALLFGKYKSVADLIKSGTSEERITAAVVYHDPGSIISGEEYGQIAATFNEKEWVEYATAAAISKTSYYCLKRLHDDAQRFFDTGRYLFANLMIHKSAVETAAMLTDIFRREEKNHIDYDKTLSLAPTLYGWNIGEDKTVTPDFKQDFGGENFEKLITKAMNDARAATATAKATATAYHAFRESVAPYVTIPREFVFHTSQFAAQLEKLTADYTPSEEYKEEPGDAATGKIVYPSWFLTEPSDEEVKNVYDDIMNEYEKHTYDLARFIIETAGISNFALGKYNIKIEN